jgi:hypothetical protein
MIVAADCDRLCEFGKNQRKINDVAASQQRAEDHRSHALADHAASTNLSWSTKISPRQAAEL